jgi:hypothetical protein
MAFYNCIDVNIGGTGGGGDNGGGDNGGGGQPTSQPTATRTSAPAPTATRTATSTATSTATATGSARGTWKAFRDYKVGESVTFDGVRYTVRQSHTSLPGWEPSIHTLALWLPA